MKCKSALESQGVRLYISVPMLIRGFPIALVALVYFSSSQETAGIALILGVIISRMSFGADFERLERKHDFSFFGKPADEVAIKQYELLHESAFQSKRPEVFDEATALIQRQRSTAFSLVDSISPMIIVVLAGHYIWQLLAK